MCSVNIALLRACTICNDGLWTLNAVFFLLQSGSFEITILGYWFKNVFRWGGFAGIFWLSDRLWESESVAVLRAMQCVCAVLPGAVIRFINAGITRDGSSPRLLTHSVASFLSWEPLELPLSLFLSPPSASLTRLSCLLVSQTISALPPVSYLSLSFPHRLSFHLLPPLFFSRLFCFLRVTSVYVCLSLCHSPLQSVRADISGSLRQVVRRGLTRLREIRDEKRSVRVTIRVNLSDTSCDVLKVVRTRRTHSARSRLLTGK